MEVVVEGRGGIRGVVAEIRGDKVRRVRFVRGRLPKRTEGAASEVEKKLGERLSRDLSSYLEGKPVDFSVYKVEPETGTVFQHKVWRAMRKIPYGRTRPYGWIAKKIGKPGAARAVGNACGSNPLPIIQPCHRVVASGGRLGGFSAGLELKRKLLALEGVVL